MTSVHPKTGLRYIITIRPQPAFRDMVGMYSRVAKKVGWLQVLSNRAFEARMDEISNDDRAFVVMWGVRAPTPGPGRRCTVVRVWSEAFDLDEKKMVGGARGWFSILRADATRVDAIFGHTPWMAESISGKLPGYVLPLGWDPDTMGAPNWKEKKRRRFVTWGTPVGKREWAYPALESLMGNTVLRAKVWSRAAVNTLNQSVANLYVSHSDVQSFSTFRTWQTVASSAAMIAERGRDCWPMTDEVYVGIPTLTRENIKEVGRGLMEQSDAFYAEKSRALHASLSHMTIDHVIENYLIPASMEIKDRR